MSGGFPNGDLPFYLLKLGSKGLFYSIRNLANNLI